MTAVVPRRALRVADPARRRHRRRLRDRRDRLRRALGARAVPRADDGRARGWTPRDVRVRARVAEPLLGASVCRSPACWPTGSAPRASSSSTAPSSTLGGACGAWPTVESATLLHLFAGAFAGLGIAFSGVLARCSRRWCGSSPRSGARFVLGLGTGRRLVRSGRVLAAQSGAESSRAGWSGALVALALFVLGMIPLAFPVATRGGTPSAPGDGRSEPRRGASGGARAPRLRAS